MTNKDIRINLDVLDDKLEFDEFCRADGTWVDVHQLICEARERINPELTNDFEINTAVRMIINFYPTGCNALKIGKYTVYHHGDGLYSVRTVDSTMVNLVEANSPHEAAMKVRDSIGDD